ncbi:hypothetical protein H8959_002033 [Pygathrix nigripes]
MKKPFGLSSKMGKWCCHCFPSCRGSSKNNVDSGGDHDDIAFLEPRTALHLACGNSEVVKLLLDRKCQLHVFDSKKRTVLIKVEEEMQRHGSNNVGISENLTGGAAAGNGDDGLIPQRKSRKPENQQFPTTENEQYHSPEKKFNEKNKVKSEIHSVDDLDDITWPSEIASEDYDLLYPNYETFMLLTEQLKMDFNGSTSLSKIQDAVLSDEHLLELKNNHCEQLTVEIENMENMIHVLQKKLSETKETQLQLEHEKDEWEQELSALSHKKEKDLLHENSMLQEEIAMLRLELDIVKHQNQLKEKKYFEDIESVKEEHDNLLKAIKLNEEAKTVFQYNGQLNILTTENKMLSSELKNVKYNKE